MSPVRDLFCFFVSLLVLALILRLILILVLVLILIILVLVLILVLRLRILITIHFKLRIFGLADIFEHLGYTYIIPHYELRYT